MAFKTSESGRAETTVISGKSSAHDMDDDESGWRTLGRFRVSDVSLLLPSEKAMRMSTNSEQDADPENLIPVSRVVSARPGCFRWFSGDESIASVTAEPDGQCKQKKTSGSARIVSRHATTNTSSTVVTAFQEDPDTGEEHEINIEVYIAPIHGIRILTTVRRLNLFEAETLLVQAFDSEENVFSSLSGLAFEWTRSHAIDENAQIPLKLYGISHSDVAPSDELVQELYGRFGYKVEIKGVKTGPATVSATLKYVGLGGVESLIMDTVTIDVVDSLAICPPAPILTPSASLQVVGARKVNRNKWSIIEGTGEGRYHWRVEGSPVVEIAEPSGRLQAVELGRGRLVLEEKNYPTNSLSVPIVVVDPDSMFLWFAPVPADMFDEALVSSRSSPCTWLSGGRFPLDTRLPKARFWQRGGGATRWLMVVGRQYYIMATLWSESIASNQMIFVTDEMEFDFEKTKSAQKDAEGGLNFLDTADMTQHFANNVRIVEATRAGFIDLFADFAGSNLQVMQSEVQIVDPVGLNKYLIRLPVDFVSGIMHSYEIQAYGGTGQYLYYADEENSVVDVDRTRGSLLVRQQLFTNQSITVEDMNDNSNFANAFVYVSEPSSLQFQESELYVTIGDSFPLQAILNDMDKQLYDNCTGLDASIKWDVHGNAVAQSSIDGLGDRVNASVCSERWFHAVSAGSTTVIAQYSPKIRASLRIVVLDKVRIVSPEPDLNLDSHGRPVALTMVYASVDMLVIGGKPNDADMQVFSVGEGEKRVALTKDPRREEDYVGISQKPTGDRLSREYKLTCRREGDFEIVLQNTATMVLICRPAERAILSVLPSIEYDGVSCGTGPSAANMVNGYDLPLRLDALDKDGRRFSTLGGLTSTWDFKESTAKDTSAINFAALEHRTLADPMRFVKVASGYTGKVTILGMLHFDDGNVDHKISLPAQFNLGVYQDLALSPAADWPVIADPEVEHRMQVIQGPPEKEGVLECSAISNARLLVVSVVGRDVAARYAANAEPMDADASLACHMRCLIGSVGVQTQIHFRRIAKLVLSGPTKLREGQKSELFMQAFSRENDPFSATMLQSLVPALEASPPNAISFPAVISDARCVASSKVKDARACAGEWHIPVTGTHSSEVLLRGSIMHGSVSVDYKIRVYKGVEIVPGPEKTVAPGVKFRLHRRFGPFIDPTECHFEVSSETALEILDEHRGLFMAKSPGNSKACVVCREDGETIDKACIDVYVKVLSAMKIEPSLVHIVEGGEMRLRGIFPEIKEHPVDYGVIPRDFVWSVENRSIAAIRGPSSRSEYSIWLTGLKPGTTQINLRSSSLLGHGTLETSVVVVVEQKLKLLVPSQIVVPRMGSFQVRTSVDSIVAKTGGTLSFFVGGRACHHRTAESNNVVTVDADGLIKASARLGETPIVVEYRSLGAANEDIVQFATVHVGVREIAFIGIRELWPDLVVPQGLPHVVHVALYDRQGEKFTAPFNTVEVSAASSDSDVLTVKDDALASSQHEEGLHRLAIEGLATGVSTLFLSINAPTQEVAREDYVRVAVIPGIEGVRFSLESAGPHDLRTLLLVPGQPLLVPVQTMNHLNVTKKLSCEALIGTDTLTTAMKVYNDSSAACQILVPAGAHGADQDRLVLSLKIMDQVISSQTVPFRFGFRLVPADEESSHHKSIVKGYLRWEEEEHIDIGIRGDNLDSISIASERPSLVIAHRHPHNKNLIRLDRQRNDTCGQSVHIIFESPLTGQVTPLVVFFACETTSWWPLPALLELIKWQSVIISVVVCLVASCLLCSRSSRGPFSPSGGPHFTETDRPSTIPRSSRDNDLGAPSMYRY